MITKEKAIEILKSKQEKYQLQGIELVGIFGSVAKGNQNESSDIDVLYDTVKGIENLHDKKQQLRAELENLFHAKVDLASKRYIKPFVKDEIMRDLIYVR
jgi:predicted nucleotidyltransferase